MPNQNVVENVVSDDEQEAPSPETAGLTEQEIAALAADDDDDLVTDYLDDDDDDLVDDESDDDPETEEAEAEEPEADDEEADEAAASDEIPADADPSDVRQPGPIDTGDIEAIQSKIEAADEEIGSLKEKYTEGELDFEEYSDQLTALQQTKMDAALEMQDAKTMQKINDIRVQDRWDSAQEAFFASDDGRQYSDPESTQFKFLNAAIMDLQKAEAFDGNYTQLLRDASKKVRTDAAALLGVDLENLSTPKTPQEKRDRKRAENKATKPPVTLRNTPAAEDPGEEGGKFSHLLQLKGPALERALSRMTQDDAEEWLRT